MDSQEILKSLSTLEQKLQSIESARQQVERTVNAYEGAKAQLSVLTQDFTDIYQELKNIGLFQETIIFISALIAWTISFLPIPKGIFTFLSNTQR